MRTDLVEMVVSSFERAISAVFTSSDLPYFLGGSRRFGYDRPESDTDFFVLVKNKEVETALFFGLARIGFREMPEADGYSLNLSFWRILALRGTCHIIFLNDESCYNRLEREHEKIELFLEKEPRLQEFCRGLGGLGVKGTYIYRALCCLIPKD